MPKKKVTLSLDQKIYSDFQKHCEDNAIMLSKKIELFIKEFLKSKKVLLVFSVFFLFFSFISFVGAVQISSDDFECGGNNCGSGWSGAWGFVGNCDITNLNSPIGGFHLRGAGGGSGECNANRNFDNSGFDLSNVSFWAKTDVLEAGEFCRYYYYNGTGSNLLLQLDQNNNTYVQYNFSVGSYGVSSSAGLKMNISANAIGDRCLMDEIVIYGFSSPDTTPPLITINSPLNATLNTSTPRLNLTIIEQNISNVWISLDGGANITYAHSNGTIDFGKLNLIFADDFNNYPDGSNASPAWTNPAQFSSALVENKTYKLFNETAIIDALSYITNFNYLNYEVTSKVMVPTGFFGGAYLTPRFGNVNNKYEIALDYDFSSININKAVGGAWSNLAALWTGDLPTPIYVSKNEWRTLGAKIYGDNISAYVDNQLALNVVDAGLRNYTGFSIIAFDDADTHKAFFDDIAINTELSAGAHTLTIYANDTSGNINSSSVAFFVNVSDVLKPVWVIEPQNQILNEGEPFLYDIEAVDNIAIGTYFLNDNVNFSINQSGFIKNITILQPLNYTLNISVNDTSSNILSKVITINVNLVDTIAPTINVQSPTNTTYNTNAISFNATADETIGTWIVNYNGTNITIDIGTILNVEPGFYHLLLYANDASNNWGLNDTIYFTVDTIAPSLTITSPQNTTYSSSSIELNVSANEPINTWWYSLDYGGNITFIPNITITANEGVDNITVYANDSVGNMNFSSISFTVNTAPDVQILYPENKTYPFSISELNYTASDLNLDSCWYSINNGVVNTTITCGQNVTGITSSEGANVWMIWVNDSSGNINASEVSFFVNTSIVSPIINISYPSYASTYLNNQSLALNFSLKGDVDSCWYNIDNGNNVSILNCQSTTFNAGSNGEHVLRAYVNESVSGKIGEDDLVYFINTSSSTIHLLAPEHEFYTNSSSMNFSYIPSPSNVPSCELWGDFNGTYSLIQTDNSVEVNQTNVFDFENLTEGNYSWAIACINYAGNYSITGNRTLFSDFTKPNITSPSNLTSSSENITISYVINDSSPTTCSYNITAIGSGLLIINGTKECQNSIIFINFIAPGQGGYVSTFVASDAAGNSQIYQTIIIYQSSSSSSSGGGGGGGSSVINPSVISGINRLELQALPKLIMKKGDVKQLSLQVRNAGTNFLNDCQLKAKEGFSSWIKSSGVKDLSAGEIHEFNFELNIPKEIESKTNTVGFELKCKETSASGNLSVEIIEEKLKFTLIELKRQDENYVKLIYSLQDLSGTEQEVELQFLLSNADKSVEVKDKQVISAFAEKSFEILIPVNSSLKGELNLLINLNSGIYSGFFEEDVILGAPISGFTLFGDPGKGNTYVSVGIIILFCIFAFFKLRNIFRHKKELNNRKKVKVLKESNKNKIILVKKKFR